MVEQWPLTGRDTELDALIGALRSNASGVVVTGDAGVGKSRLLGEFAHEESRRRIVRITGFTATRDIPFGATSAWLGTAPPDPTALVQAAIAAIAGDPEPGTALPIVIVDDAQWLDDASAMAVNRLAIRHLAFVVVALRTLDGAPDAIVELWRDDAVDHLPLQPLTFDETRTLLTRVLRGRLHRQTADELWTITGGNLLYIREIVNADLATGRLTTTADEISWAGPSTVTETLTELIDQQLGTIDEPLTDLIDVLAIAGALHRDTLGAVHGLSPDLVERAQRADLIVVDDDPPTVRLVHPLYAEIRLHRLGRLRRSRLQSTLADAMGIHRTGNPRDDMLRAVLALESGGEHDPDLFLVGAGAASAWCDIPLTLSLAQAAVAAGAGFPAEMMYAYHLTVANQGPQADAALAALLAKPGLPADTSTLLSFMHAGNRFWVMQRPEEAEQIVAEAIAAASPDADTVSLTALRGAIAAYRGRHDDAQKFTAQALDDPGLAGIPHIFCAMGRTISLGATGRYSAIEQYRQRAHDDAAVSVPGSIRYSLLTLELQAAGIAGDLAAADEIARSRRDEADDLPGFARTLTTYMRGYAAYFHGHVADAADCIRGVVARLAADPRATPGWEYACRTRLATLYALAGNVAKADEHHRWIEHNPHPAIGYIAAEILLSRGWREAAAAQVSRALDYAAQAAALARERGEAANEVTALQVTTQWGDGAAAAARLAELAESVDGPRAGLAARYARALADRDADELWAASGAWAALGDQIAAADSAAQASAEFTAADRHALARLAGDTARRTAAAHGFVTPALRAMAAPAQLSRREWEIVELLAGGRTNRDIAERLDISTRTVEGHIYRAMGKTDCESRAELAALAAGQLEGRA